MLIGIPVGNYVYDIEVYPWIVLWLYSTVTWTISVVIRRAEGSRVNVVYVNVCPHTVGGSFVMIPAVCSRLGYPGASRLTVRVCAYVGPKAHR